MADENNNTNVTDGQGGHGGGRGGGRGRSHSNSRFHRSGRGGSHHRRGGRGGGGPNTPRSDGGNDSFSGFDQQPRLQRNNSNSSSQRGGRGGRGGTGPRTPGNTSRGGRGGGRGGERPSAVQLFPAVAGGGGLTALGERNSQRSGRGGNSAGGPVRRVDRRDELRRSPPSAETSPGSPGQQRPSKGGNPASSPSAANRWQQQRPKRGKAPKRNRVRTQSIGVGTDKEDDGWERHAPKPRIEGSNSKSQSAGSAKTKRTRPSCTPPAEAENSLLCSSSDDEAGGSGGSDGCKRRSDEQHGRGSLTLCQNVHWTDGQSTTLRTLQDLLADDQPVMMEADTPVIGPRPTAGGSCSPVRTAALPPATAMAVDSVATPNTFKILHTGRKTDTAILSGTPVFGDGMPSSASSVEPALPPAAMHPVMPRVDLFEFLMQDYNEQDNSFGWQTTEEGRGRMFGAVHTLVAEATPLLKQRPLLRHVQAPAYVLGDIHGNFQDLRFFIKSLLTFGDIRLTTTHILCLGDYVDRGEHSLECLILLLALFVIAPDKVTLLRGNHEDRVVCGDKNNYGTMCFYGQCEAVFGVQDGRRLFANVTRVFQHFPLAVILDTVGPTDPVTGVVAPGGRALCTHGGFPRFNCNPLEDDQLAFLATKEFPRFLTLFPNNPLSDMADVEGLPATLSPLAGSNDEESSNKLFAAAVASTATEMMPTEEDLSLSWTVPGAASLSEERHQRAWFSTFDMMWSDPTLEDEGAGVDSWGFGRSTRGQAVVCFTAQAVETFLKVHRCNMLFRAHQEKAHGIRLSKSSKVLTIFSSSNYLGHGNGAGCAVISAHGEVRLVVKSGEEEMFATNTSD